MWDGIFCSEVVGRKYSRSISNTEAENICFVNEFEGHIDEFREDVIFMDVKDVIFRCGFDILASFPTRLWW